MPGCGGPLWAQSAAANVNMTNYFLMYFPRLFTALSTKGINSFLILGKTSEKYPKNFSYKLQMKILDALLPKPDRIYSGC